MSLNSILNHSTFSSQLIDNETDIFSQEKFGQLWKGSDFYVCRVQEVDKNFYFEGSKFLEHFLRNQQEKKQSLNPTTKQPITSFKVFKKTINSSDFSEVFDEKSAILHVNALPILLSSETPLKSIYYFRLGECYRLGKDCTPDPAKAITYLRLSAELGHTDAQHNLSLLLAEKGFIRESIDWALKPWRQTGLKIPIKGLIDLGNCFERLHYYTFAFPFFHEAACQGNPHAIAKVIRYYEQGLGRLENPEKVRLWREFIPAEWQGKSSKDYLLNTCKMPGILDQAEDLQLPPSLTNDRVPLTFPDLEFFPEKSFSFLDKLLTILSKIYEILRLSFLRRLIKEHQDC